MSVKLIPRCDAGTVLIDAFDSPPRPILDTVPSPDQSFKTSSARHDTQGAGLPTPPTPPTPEKNESSANITQATSINSTQLPRANPPIRPLRAQNYLATPITSPATSSGPSTPQLSLDDSSEPNLDEIYEMLGGGALYALVGARLWLPPSQLRTLVDRAPESENSELPSDAEDKLKALGEDIWVWNRAEGSKMIRARIRYEGDVRFFQPIVQARHRTMAQIYQSPLFGAEYLHISPPYSPENVFNLLEEMKTIEENAENQNWKPKIVFEPTPPSCHPGQREWLEKIVPNIEVLSPNHEEIFSILGIPLIDMSSMEFISTVEGIIKYFLDEIGIGKDGQGVMIVRCGKLGACIGTKQKGLRWCPAYFQGKDQVKVKDVTGAGNSFLGGFVAGLSLANGDPYEAVLHGTVSASFVVQQFGLPILSSIEGVERWNDDSPQSRLEELRKRLSQ
uniref:PfkB family carbohydrate kinase superfamily protein n=1 Tax=Kwoniella pini CBS 10737 TaxID=1296096 RepID=A0A1B9HTD3_9TREE|nr:pfkB family carbohydrate kinase superfamily protein [Kwoniella pini CBS 10737]OCF46532.1 pfkB family carbohydrate kinase superfamily protein [Kwoniella pini CBS 10737]